MNSCEHEYDGNGIYITAIPTAKCKKCGEEFVYYCDETGKPTLLQLLGEEYEHSWIGDREIIKKKEDKR